MRRIKLFCITFFVVFGVFAVAMNHNRVIEHASSSSSGPPTGFTGAPDENNCTACHLGPKPTGQFAILAPDSYVPGETYLVRVRHTTADISRKRWGFQMTSLSGSTPAGSFGNLSPATQVLKESGREYVEHTQVGNYAGQLGGSEWVFSWTAPPADMGPISFWAAGVQGNRANGPDGDQVYLSSAVLPVGSPTATPTPTAPQYQIFDIGVVQPGDTASQGFGVSNGGVAVGRSFRPSNAGTQAFTWTQGGGLVGLPNPVDRAFAVSNSANDNGIVVGTGATTAFGSGRLPLIWQNGSVSQLTLPPGETIGDANDINSFDTIVGSVDGGSLQQAVFYRGGEPTVITQATAEGSFFVTAFGVNNAGRVIGTGIDPNNAARNVGMVFDIGSPNAAEVGALPGANGALAFGVSNAGHVTGSSMMNQGSGLPFIWTSSGGIQAVPLPAGTTQGSGRAVNSDGWVVGTASSAFAIPFLYDGNATYRLQDIIPAGNGWDLSTNTSSSALGISDDGVIVGTGVLNGQVHAYAMVPDAGGTPTPTPTPSPTPSGTPFVLNEGFDTVTSGIPGPGWVAQNNSDPVGAQPTWFQGNTAVFSSQQGPPSSYIAANFNLAGGNGTISAWLLTPELPLVNGSVVKFWTRSAGDFPDRLQVRMSTAGGSTNVGTSHTSVGDFTSLLLDINPTYAQGGYPSVWTEQTVTINGLLAPTTGRLAFRYFVENSGPLGTNGDYIGIDTFQYSTPAPVLPDLTATKTNNLPGGSSSCGAWTWTITVRNEGTGIATFENGQAILRDDLPDANVTYGLPAAGNFSGVTGAGNVIPLLFSPGSLTVTATGPVTIAPGGSFTVSFRVTPASDGVFLNPRPGGSASVDPNNVLVEGNETNNTFSDAVTVTECTTPTPTPTPTPSPSASPTPLYTRADYDGDNKTDLTVWRASGVLPPPNQNDSVFYTERSSNGTFFGIQFGNLGDVPVAGDFDGDNKTDFAVTRYNTSDAGVDIIYLESSTNTAKFPVWGNAGDIFVSGDYDGDNKTDVMAWRPSDGTWYIVNSSGANGGFSFIQHGQSLDKVYAMDTDGDGSDNLVYFRPSTGNWVVRNNDGSTTTTNFGLSSDIPVPADYDGDNKDDIAIYRDGLWVVLRSSNGQVEFTPFGDPGDVPVPGDYDGDNLYDRAVFRQGIWHMLRSSQGYTGKQFGASTDIPMPKTYIP